MKYQRGVTLSGLIFFMLILGFCLYAAARVLPAYTDYWLIKRVMEQISIQPDIKDIKDSEVRMRLSNDLRMNNITVVSQDDIDIERIPSGVHLSTTYSVKTPFIGAVHLSMDFQPDVSSK